MVSLNVVTVISLKRGLTLIHDANLAFSYWLYAFQTTSYLINRQPTPLIQEKWPFEALFGQPPNYLKLKKNGCICYPLTRAYNSNKMQPKSKVCIFLDYSPTQNTYKCFEPQIKKFFLSRHVLFDENLTHSSLSQTASSVTTQPTRESHNSFSLFFFNAQQVVMSPSQLSDAPTSSLPPKGPPAIVASSSGNFGLSVSFLHDF